MNIESIQNAVNIGNEKSRFNAEVTEGIQQCRHVLTSLGLSSEDIQRLADEKADTKVHMFN